ncbi:MAG: hypothetical protein J6L02_04840, partial [Bacteroidales bacterium]|nr:hypothetical protein [Bacteroidales bacterium]
GESFRLPTSNEMKQIVSYITFKSPVNYVWCNDYKDDVNLYSAGPEGPDIPVTPSTRLVFGKNSSVQSISMTYKNKTIGFVIIKE